MVVFWIAQGIGLIALGFSILAYQSKTKQELLSRQMAGAFVYALHYFLLSAWTGLFMNLIVAVRNWIFGKKNQHAWADNPFWMWFFIALALGTLPFIWEGPISFLPVTGIILGVYSRWQEKISQIRLYTIIGCVLWIPYNLVVRSYSGVLVDIIVIVATFYGIWKHDRVTLAEKV